MGDRCTERMHERKKGGSGMKIRTEIFFRENESAHAQHNHGQVTRYFEILNKLIIVISPSC
jgi:hypothetical protein